MAKLLPMRDGDKLNHSIKLFGQMCKLQELKLFYRMLLKCFFRQILLALAYLGCGYFIHRFFHQKLTVTEQFHATFIFLWVLASQLSVSSLAMNCGVQLRVMGSFIMVGSLLRWRFLLSVHGENRGKEASFISFSDCVLHACIHCSLLSQLQNCTVIKTTYKTGQ